MLPFSQNKKGFHVEMEALTWVFHLSSHFGRLHFPKQELAPSNLVFHRIRLPWHRRACPSATLDKSVKLWIDTIKPGKDCQ